MIAKLRKMLGDVSSGECAALMRLIETQSKHTLAAWAVRFVKKEYLPICQKELPQEHRLEEAIAGCEEYLAGTRKLNDVKPLLREAKQAAVDAAANPAAQAAARAISTACAAVQTPTNSLGFVFYGAAAAAYSTVGLDQSAEVYDRLAAEEFEKATKSLQEVAIADEPNPARISWNC